MITPMNPKTNPKNCLRVTSSLNQMNAMIIVLNAVVAFRIAKIFESAPKLPYEKSVKGIALFVTAKTSECFQAGFSRIKYFLLNSIGRKTKDAIIKRIWTSPIAPNSGAAILIKINALPQIAPRNVRTSQYLNSIIKNKKTLNKIEGCELIFV